MHAAKRGISVPVMALSSLSCCWLDFKGSRKTAQNVFHPPFTVTWPPSSNHSAGTIFYSQSHSLIPRAWLQIRVPRLSLENLGTSDSAFRVLSSPHPRRQTPARSSLQMGPLIVQETSPACQRGKGTEGSRLRDCLQVYGKF